MTYVRPNIYKQTNIPDFQLCYPESVSLANYQKIDDRFVSKFFYSYLGW